MCSEGGGFQLLPHSFHSLFLRLCPGKWNLRVIDINSTQDLWQSGVVQGTGETSQTGNVILLEKMDSSHG